MSAHSIAQVAASAAGAEVHEVTAQRTATAPSEIRAALAVAYRGVTGHPAGGKTLDVLTAHVSHETGRGGRMFNFNFGGIKGAAPGGATARYATREVTEGGADRHLVDGFRAYRSLAQGATDYVRYLHDHHAPALAAAGRGDVDGFCTSLKLHGYFTEHLEAYEGAMHGLAGDGTATGRVATGRPNVTESALPLDAVDLLTAPGGAAFPSSMELARVLDAVASMTARVGAPVMADEKS